LPEFFLLIERKEKVLAKIGSFLKAKDFFPNPDKAEPKG
jgi:hypothetical protein